MKKCLLSSKLRFLNQEQREERLVERSPQLEVQEPKELQARVSPQCQRTYLLKKKRSRLLWILARS